MSEPEGSLRSSLNGPRWARSDQAIKDLCWELGLKCEVEREVTLLRERVRFEVIGELSAIYLFRASLGEAVREWNS